MASTLRLIFNTTIDRVDVLKTLNMHVNTGTGIVSLGEKWVDVRTAPKQVSIVDQMVGSDIAEDAALMYMQAWNTDHKSYGGKNISTSFVPIDENHAEVILTITDPVWTFEAPTGTLVTGGVVTHEILESSIEPANSTTATVSPNTADPCGKIDVDLVIGGDTGIYSVYTSEGNYLGVTSPYTISFIRRAVHQQINIFGVNHPISIVELDLPRKINESDISLDLIYALGGGATVTINVGYNNTYISPYEYSLNGTDYQSSNSFPSVLPGSYTVYVKDAFGCVTTKSILIDGVTALTEIVFNISEINPIRFIPNRAPGDKKNFLNSLACEDIKQMPYSGRHPYPYESVIPIQFQTNAPYIRVYAVDKNSAETTINHYQAVKNTDLTGYTTATLYSKNNKAVLYWGYVDKLDPLTDDVIGNTNFGAFVPTWADDSGKLLEVEGIGTVAVSKIYYDSLKQANVAELTSSYTGPEVVINVKGNYNEQPYDVYEFETVMALLPDTFRLCIDYGTDAGNLELGYKSEDIVRIVDSDEFIRVDYWDEDNVGNFIYQTGIHHHIYLKAVTDYVGEQNSEGYNGDNEYYKTNDEIYFSFNFIAEFVPSTFAHKLRIICAHKNLYINGLKCKLAETPEVEGELATNLKTFTALLKTSGNQFLPMEAQNVLKDADNLSGALEAIQGKANILWTKTNG